MLDINTGISLVKFGATWCGPCKGVASILQKAQPEFQDIKFEEVDVDDNPDLTKIYKIKSVPTVIVFKDGVEVQRLVGTFKIDVLKKVLSEVLEGVA